MAKNANIRLGRWVILIIAIILGLVLSLVNFLFIHPSKEYVGTSLELLYDGAAEGLAPNGGSFSIDGIRNEALLQAAIEENSLSDKISVEELSQNMVVRGSYPANIIDQIKSWTSLFASDPTREITVEEYYPTTYKVSLYNSFSNKLSSAQLKGLLNSIVSGYKQFYKDQYSAGMDWAAMKDLWKTGTYDYSQAITTLSLHLEMIRKYSKELYDAEPTFVTADGSTFSSIMLRADTIASNDIQSLSANITINALSKDIARLRSQYNYEIEQLTYRLSSLKTEQENINALIDGYEKDSDIYYSSGDSVITVKGNSKETYEALVEKKTAIANEISEITISIDDYRNKVNDLDASAEAGTSSAYRERIESAIAAAREKIEELSADFDKMAAAYNDEFVKTTDVSNTEVKYHGSSLLSTSYIKAIIKSEAPVCAVALVIVAAIGIVRETKAEKRRKA